MPPTEQHKHKTTRWPAPGERKVKAIYEWECCMCMLPLCLFGCFVLIKTFFLTSRPGAIWILGEEAATMPACLEHSFICCRSSLGFWLVQNSDSVQCPQQPHLGCVVVVGGWVGGGCYSWHSLGRSPQNQLQTPLLCDSIVQSFSPLCCFVSLGMGE